VKEKKGETIYAIEMPESVAKELELDEGTLMVLLLDKRAKRLILKKV